MPDIFLIPGQCNNNAMIKKQMSDVKFNEMLTLTRNECSACKNIKMNSCGKRQTTARRSVSKNIKINHYGVRQTGDMYPM